MTITAAAYVRVSTDEQAEQGVSIPSQKTRLQAYIQSQGWELYDFYIDDGYSGKDLNRPDVKRMIADVKAGNIKAVVVIKLDRLSRRQKDVLYLLEDVLEPAGVGFKSVSEPFDTTTPFGKAAIGMMAVFAQLERETIVERVKDAKKESARQGRFMGGPVAFGYDHDRVNKSVIVNESTATIVRTIYNMYLAGFGGYQAISEWLDSQKIRSPKGAGWNRATVWKILSNPFYAGFIHHKGELYKGNHPAIISLEQFEQAQTIAGDRSKKVEHIYTGLIAGLIYCGECGARMRTKNVKQRSSTLSKYYVCYSQDKSTPHMIKDVNCRCGHKHTDEIDKKVIDILMSYSLNNKLIKKLSSDFMAGLNNNNDAAIERLNKELAQVKTKMARWYTAFEDGSLDPDELKDRIRDLRARRDIIISTLDKYEKEAIAKEEKARTLDETITLLRSFKLLWKKALPEEKRSLVRSLVKAVHVYQDNRVEVDFF